MIYADLPAGAGAARDSTFDIRLVLKIGYDR
jgi:hypothetical protein